MFYLAKITNSKIKDNVDLGHVVIGQLTIGNVLIDGYNGDKIYVKNPITYG